MIYGYARVSTHTQDFKGQVDTLEAEGCQTVYFEKVTGIKTDRPEFNQLLHVLKAGDTLKVTTLDRLARNTEEGISVIKTLLKKGVKVHVLNVGYIDDTAMGNFFIQTLLAVAELERNMIVERTQEGKAMARLDPNFREGRPRKYSKDQIAHAITLKETHTYSQVEDKTGISKSTLIRARRRKGLI